MANYAEEPLTRVTLNLFTKDYEYLLRRSPRGWTGEVRSMVRKAIKADQDKKVSTEGGFGDGQ